MSVVFAVNRVGVQGFRRVRANVSVRKRPLCVLRLAVRPIPCDGRLCRRYCPLRFSHVVFSLGLLGVALQLPSTGAVWRTRFPGEGRSSPALPGLAKHGEPFARLARQGGSSRGGDADCPLMGERLPPFRSRSRGRDAAPCRWRISPNPQRLSGRVPSPERAVKGEPLSTSAVLVLHGRTASGACSG